MFPLKLFSRLFLIIKEIRTYYFKKLESMRGNYRQKCKLLFIPSSMCRWLLLIFCLHSSRIFSSPYIFTHIHWSFHLGHTTNIFPFHFVTISSTFLTVTYYSTVWIHYIILNQFFIVTHWNCYQILSLINNAGILV